MKVDLCLIKDLNTWVEKNKSSVQRLMEVPADSYLIRMFRPVEAAHWDDFESVAEKRRPRAADRDLPEEKSGSSKYGGSVSGVKGAPFSLSQFSWLCLLLHWNLVAKLALHGTRQELRMEQQRNLVNRGNYWHTVAERFYKYDFCPRIYARPKGPLEIPDPSTTPPSRMGRLKLKTVLTDSKSRVRRSDPTGDSPHPATQREQSALCPFEAYPRGFGRLED